jgi:hypothetical protein
MDYVVGKPRLVLRRVARRGDNMTDTDTVRGEQSADLRFRNKSRSGVVHDNDRRVRLPNDVS